MQHQATCVAWVVLGLLAASPLAAKPHSAADESVAAFTAFRYTGHQPANASVQPDAGSYLNPVIAGSHSDPSVVRVGADTYLTNASFTLFPGGTILRSRDLVHWKQIGSAVSRPGQLDLKGLDTWQGDYANDLKYKDGIFYFLSACQDCGGPFVMTARDPAGLWSGPVFLPIEGIDTSIFFDDDGRAYVLISGPPPGGEKWEGHHAIWLQELDLRTLTLTGIRSVLVDGGDDAGGKPFWLEGPHLLRHEGRYILIAAQGGTKEAHVEVAFGADRLRGPYTADPRNPILSQSGLDPRRAFPVTQAGHADFVQTQDGAWWAFFLASRPWSGDELAYATGRETFLLPLQWMNGWPEILPKKTPVPLVVRRPRLPDAPTGEPHGGDFSFQEDFTSMRLRPDWVSLGPPEMPWWRSGGGALLLTARPDPLGGEGQPSLLAIRQQHMDFEAEVTLARTPAVTGGEAGLAAYQGRRRSLAIGVARLPDGAREARLECVSDASQKAGVVLARARLPSQGAVRLRITARGRGYTFAYDPAAGEWRDLGSIQDGTLLSVRGSSGFTGVLVGMFADRP